MAMVIVIVSRRMPHRFPHSMTLLRAMAEDVPPRAPAPVIVALREAHERFRASPPERVEAIEDAIVAFGHLLWPYRKAYEALIRATLEADDLALFTSRLSNDLRTRFRDFKDAGGSLAGLHDATRVSRFFSPEEQGRLCAALLDVRAAAEAQVRSDIEANATAYERLVTMYQTIQHEVDTHLAALYRLAEEYHEHEEVAGDIRETVRAFRRGFAQLAREPEARDVCAAIDSYRERGEQSRERRFLERTAIFS